MIYTKSNNYELHLGKMQDVLSTLPSESIDAVINYKEHNYYYFVADCKGKTYLNKDATGHYNTIQKLKNENNWCV